MDYSPIHDMYENLLRSIADPFFVIAEDGTYLDVFGGAERTLYDDATKLKGKRVSEFMDSDSAAFFMAQIHRTLESGALNNFEYQLGDDAGLWFEVRLFPLQELYRGKRAVTALIVNITERKELQHHVLQLARQDALTQQFNRYYVYEKIAQQLELFIRDRTLFSLILVDVDHFSTMNATYGCFASDTLLKQLSQVLTEQAPTGATVARFADDTFAMMVEYQKPVQIENLIGRLRTAVQEHRFVFASMMVPMSVSIGFSHITDADTDIAGIIRRAEQVLHEAKQQRSHEARIPHGI